MKIELKNIHYIEQLSEETHAFSADLHINGFKAGTASNRGHGGPTDYYAINEHGRKLIAEAEQFCKTLPAEKFTVEGKEYTLPMNLELFIDNLLTDHLKTKELQRFRRQMKRDEEKGILIGIPDQSYVIAVTCRIPVSVLLSKQDGQQAMAEIISRFAIPQLQEGQKVLNTNIPEKVLKKAGLSPGQYVSFGKKPAEKPQKKKGRGIG